MISRAAWTVDKRILRVRAIGADLLEDIARSVIFEVKRESLLKSMEVED